MIPALVIFLSLNFPNFTGEMDFQKIIDSATSGSSMEIASDASFAAKTLKFNSGQTIYVRVTAENDGSDKHVLNLRDNNYSLITAYSMTRSGNQFLVNFPAPGSSGIYSLEANITSAGSVTNFVKTIEVGGGGTGNSQVNVKIENKVNPGNQVLSETNPASPTQTPDPSNPASPTPTPAPANQGFFALIWQMIVGFFKGIF